MTDLKPGRELDALVAEKVMGWSLGCRDGLTNYSPISGNWSRERDPMEGIPYYSTDMTAAWEVVERLREKFDSLSIVLTLQGAWLVNIWNPSEGQKGAHSATEAAAPHAICLAALKAFYAS